MIKTDITPAGFSFSFNLYRTEVIPADEIAQILSLEVLAADLEKMKPGFFKMEKYTGCVLVSFAFPQKQEKEILKKGVICKLEIPVLETARLVFLPGYLTISGNNSAGKMAMQMLTPYVNISGSYISPTQEKLFDLSAQAVVIKSMTFVNIPHSEVERLTVSGELEDIFNTHSIYPLREAEISALTGVFSLSTGIKTLKFTKAGKVTIEKSKRQGVTLDLLNAVIEKVVL